MKKSGSSRGWLFLCLVMLLAGGLGWLMTAKPPAPRALIEKEVPYDPSAAS